MRLDVRKGEAIKDGANVIGNKTKIKVVKNKLAPPFKVAEFDIIYGKGISKTGCIVDLALQFGIIKKSGSWFAYNDEKIGQGKENTKSYLESNKDIYKEIEEKIKASVSSAGLPTELGDETE